MGCCGCSLSRSAVTAVVLGLLESILGMSWNILVVVVLESHKRDGTETWTTFPTTLQTLAADTATTTAVTDDSAADGETLSPWDTLRLTLTSEEARAGGRIFEVVIAALVLNSFWLLTTLALAVGNAEKCRDMLKPWIGATVIITVSDIAATIYFIFKAVRDIGDDEVDINEAFFSNIYIFLAFMFSRGGPIIWIANIALCIFVTQRVKEIEVIKKKKLPFGTDFNISPYTLQPPYETFETTDSSPRTPKNLRPHTPPPDYEGPNGYFHKKRRTSFPTDYEAMTLPLSMASSRVSTNQRPLSQGSYLYDDRVELQHRTSATAENVVNHAYENKGLVMESEGWIGIPRPTLKSGR